MPMPPTSRESAEPGIGEVKVQKRETGETYFHNAAAWLCRWYPDESLLLTQDQP